MTLEEQISRRCVHYRAPYSNAACKLGVAYAQFGRPGDLPCLKMAGETDCACAQRELPTPEAVAEEIAKMKAARERVSICRRAIVEVTHGARGVAGRMQCPACNTGTLQFSVAAYNGHIHARCSTPGCAAWME